MAEGTANLIDLTEDAPNSTETPAAPAPGATDAPAATPGESEPTSTASQEAAQGSVGATEQAGPADESTPPSAETDEPTPAEPAEPSSDQAKPTPAPATEEPADSDAPLDPLTAAARGVPSAVPHTATPTEQVAVQMLAPAAAAVVAEMAETPAVPAKVAEVPPLAAANSFGSSDQLTVRRYLDSTVVPVLRGAMRELCIKRPADPYQFLSDYILAHKPKV